MQTVDFKHEVGKKVAISINGINGTVIGNFIGEDGEKKTYVEYAIASGEIHQQYFQEEKLT